MASIDFFYTPFNNVKLHIHLRIRGRLAANLLYLFCPGVALIVLFVFVCFLLLLTNLASIALPQAGDFLPQASCSWPRCLPLLFNVFNGFGKPGKLLNNFVVTPGVHDLDTTNHRLAVTQIEAMAR